MLKRKVVFLILLLLGFLLFNFPLAAQATNQIDAGPLIGTWSDNSNPTSGIYKWIITADGKAVDYWKGNDAVYEEARYSIEKSWTDEDGNTWFQCEFLTHLFPYTGKGNEKWYVVFKIDASGEAMEQGWSQAGYKLDFHNTIHVLSHRE